MRLRSTLAVLLILLIFGASCQTAVCELACALQAQEPCCHSTEAASTMSDQMDMPDADCAHMATPPIEQEDFSDGQAHSGGCTQHSAWAFEVLERTNRPLGAMGQAVACHPNVQFALLVSDQSTAKSPPLISASSDSILISLRI